MARMASTILLTLMTLGASAVAKDSDRLAELVAVEPVDPFRLRYDFVLQGTTLYYMVRVYTT